MQTFQSPAQKVDFTFETPTEKTPTFLELHESIN